MNTINKITVSGNTYGIVDTDTKVTSAANHYTPSADNNAELTASLSGTAGAYAKDTEYTVLTGVKAQRDAKGHVTGLTYTAQKIKDTDTNTWRSISDSVSSTSSDTSASSKAVKTAYDLAASKTSNTGTVTSVAAGTGLSGGTITTSGTLYVKYGTTAGTACQGNDSRLSNARAAADVYSWAKASTKPTYIASEVMSISLSVINSNTSSSCSISGSGNAGKAQTIVYFNNGSSDVTVTVPTTYHTPDGEAIELTCPVGGYCEVSYLNIDGIIFARGL